MDIGGYVGCSGKTCCGIPESVGSRLRWVEGKSGFYLFTYAGCEGQPCQFLPSAAEKRLRFKACSKSHAYNIEGEKSDGKF